MKRSRSKLIVRLAIALPVFLVGVMVIAGFYELNRPILTQSQNSVVFEFAKNETVAQLMLKLSEAPFMSSPRLLFWIIRIKGLSHQLQAGIYEVQPGETAWQLLEKIVAGDVLQLPFRMIEGTTQHQVAQNLQDAPYLIYQAEDWDVIQKKQTTAEGLLLADTYQYKAGSPAIQLLRQANHNLTRTLQKAWLKRDPDLPYSSPYQLLIAASIIEKETALIDERRLISGVIVNRLKKKMRLQMDPTVIYGLGPQFDGKLTKSDLKKPTPYNTYVYYGLPPTPIAMVGRAAIEAAAHPKDSNYFYYVAKGDGSHQFSENYEQQKKAIEVYIKRNRAQ